MITVRSKYVSTRIFISINGKPFYKALRHISKTPTILKVGYKKYIEHVVI